MENSNQLNKGQNSVSKYLDFLPDKGSESSFLYKKTERLVAGTYLITDRLSDTEPMRNALRSQALRLLEDSIDLMYRSFESERKLVLDNLTSGVMELVALFEAGKLSGLISESNTELIRDEFFGFLTALRAYIEKPALPVFSKDFFGVETSVRSENLPAEKSDLKDSRNLVEGSSKLDGSISPKSFKAKKDSSNVRLDKSVKKESRRDTIISLLKKKKELTIKDFSLVIVGCSEKTIQRELTAMLSEGVLKRTGERRWSRYSLSNK